MLLHKGAHVIMAVRNVAKGEEILKKIKDEGATGKGTVLLLDGWKGVEETLATKRVNILKINADELRWLTGEADLDAGAAAAMARHMAPDALLAVTRGPKSALLYSAADAGNIVVTEFEIEEVRALNPIGAGDTCSSVMLYGVCAGYDAADAFAFALAAASGQMRCVRGESRPGREPCVLAITLEGVWWCERRGGGRRREGRRVCLLFLLLSLLLLPSGTITRTDCLHTPASCLNIAGAQFKSADAIHLYNAIKRKPPRTLGALPSSKV